jgi:hypothetical protein
MKTETLSNILNSSSLFNELEKRDYIGASNIGAVCERFIWYRFHNKKTSPRAAHINRTLEIGKRLESMLVDMLREVGFEVVTPSKDNAFLSYSDKDFSLFKGHLDAIIYNSPSRCVSILEIKTARDSSFNIFKKNGLRRWYPAYYAQVQSYMGLSGIHSAFMMAINKDTSELHDEYVEFDKNIYAKLLEKAKKIASMDSAPDRISNSPLYFGCRICDYRSVCHG